MIKKQNEEINNAKENDKTMGERSKIIKIKSKRLIKNYKDGCKNKIIYS